MATSPTSNPSSSLPRDGARRSATSAGRNSHREKVKEREPNPIKRFFKILGPGLITGASDDDPSGIGTYAMAGAQLGYAPLWTALVTFPLMASVQFICAKIGLVTGKGLAGILRQYYSAPLLHSVVLGLVIANTINAGADIGAIAAGINLLLPIPQQFLIFPIGLLLLVIQISGSYRIVAKILKWLTLSLFGYIGASFLARPDWTGVIHGTFIPTISFDAASLAILVAILGTTISPYLFFWQASQEVEEEIAKGRKQLWQRRRTSDSDLKYAAWDVNTGMLLSNLVMYFIILATAATLHQAGKTNIGTAADAAVALRPLAGNAAYILMALGLIGSGLLAVPILTTSGAYAVCESFGWKWGLDRKFRGAKQFYIVIGASTLIGLFINLIRINPMDALFWTAVINGFVAPPLLVVIMLISNNKTIMGKRVNGPGVNALGWFTTVAMLLAALALGLTWGKAPG